MNNIIVINKEKGYTSRDIVNIAQKVYKTKKVGHTGTLDPIAEGVLIICMNKALKVAEFITSDIKEYIATLTLGFETDTLDITGKTIYTSSKKVNKEEVKKVLNDFIGKYNQEVPKYSAVKVNGKKLYEYARNNIDIKLPKKEVTIYNIELISDITDNKFKIKCLVSKGTYIRSLIRDIGRKLETYATMDSLIRTKQGEIDISMTSSIKELKENKAKTYKIDEILKLPKIKITDETILKKVKNGANIDVDIKDNKVFIVDKLDNIIAIYEKINKNEAKLLKMIDNSY